MTSAERLTSRCPVGRGFVLLVLAVLAGVLACWRAGDARSRPEGDALGRVARVGAAFRGHVPRGVSESLSEGEVQGGCRIDVDLARGPDSDGVVQDLHSDAVAASLLGKAFDHGDHSLDLRTMAACASTSPAIARWDTGAVLAVVTRLAGPDLLARILRHLPGGYALLFGQAELRQPQPTA